MIFKFNKRSLNTPLIFFYYRKGFLTHVVLVVVLCVLEQVHLLRVLAVVVVEHARIIIHRYQTLVRLVIVIIIVILVVEACVQVLVLHVLLPIAITDVTNLLVLIYVINFVLVGQRINPDADVIIYAIIVV